MSKKVIKHIYINENVCVEIRQKKEGIYYTIKQTHTNSSTEVWLKIKTFEKIAKELNKSKAALALYEHEQ